ncbi:DNA polymerase III beta subunit [Synechococcus phage Ssp-JY38]|nr:DNA polymerase III subunit beta [Synechococcus phage Yong-L2-223]
MTIEKSLKYIIGAVARKDHVESLCHLLIRDGTAIAYDGMLSMSTPIDIDLHAKPHAKTMLKAIQACDDEKAISLHMTQAQRLAVRSGAFRAYVPCLGDEDEMHQPLPEGEHVEVTPRLMDSIRAMAPLMGIDASRAWSQGLRLCGNSTFATNNILLAEYWHGANFPHEIIIPADAVKELLRINVAPTHAQVTDSSATFFFEGDRWLRTQLVGGQWPIEQVTALLDAGGNPQPLPQGFFDALRKLRAFVDDAAGVRIHADRITTTNEEQSGAAVELESVSEGAHFNINQILLLDDIATKIDFMQHPQACYWQGNKVRGVIIGRSD